MSETPQVGQRVVIRSSGRWNGLAGVLSIVLPTGRVRVDVDRDTLDTPRRWWPGNNHAWCEVSDVYPEVADSPHAGGPDGK